MFARSGRRRRRKRRWPSIGEGHINRRLSPRYAAKKASLQDPQVRLSLDLVEEALIAEPDNWTHRTQVGSVIWDTSEAGLAVAAAIEDGELVLLTFIETYRA